MGFSRPEYWSGLPCPPPGDLPDPGIEPTSLKPICIAGEFFSTLAPPWEALMMNRRYRKRNGSKNNMETHSDDNAEPFPASRGQSGTRISIGRSTETSTFPSQLSVNI